MLIQKIFNGLFKKNEAQTEYERLQSDWEKRLEEVGGQHYYKEIPEYPRNPYGIYKGLWINVDGFEQWFDVGVNPGGYVFVGNEINKPGPKNIGEFVLWFGPVYLFDETSESEKE